MWSSGTFLVLLIVAIASPIIAQDGCIINIPKLPPPSASKTVQPVVLSSSYEFMYAKDSSRDLTIAVDDSIVIACPGGELDTELQDQSSLIKPKCNQDLKLEVDGTVIDFFSIVCTSERLETARYTGEQCGNTESAEIMEIGFQIDEETFVPSYHVCFDKFYRYSLYAGYPVSPDFFFDDGGGVHVNGYEYDMQFYNIDIPLADIYNKTRIQEVYRQQLGYSDGDFEQRTDWMEMRRAMNTVWKFQYNTTHHFMNTYPTWVLGVHSNWDIVLDIENTVARNKSVNLLTYTGVFGVNTYEHADTGEQINIYLHLDENENPSIPVPAVFWKILYQPQDKLAAVLISINSHYSFTTDKYRNLCDDVSDSMPYLNWDQPKNESCGFSYACSYPQAKAAIPVMPELDVIDILT